MVQRTTAARPGRATPPRGRVSKRSCFLPPTFYCVGVVPILARGRRDATNTSARGCPVVYSRRKVPPCPPAPQAPGFMRKTFLALLTLAVAWVGYLAWPLYELVQLVDAVERGDVARVARRVDFGRLRASLTQQIVEAYLQRAGGGRSGALVPGAVASIADPIVAKIISPEALAEFLRIGWPRTALPEAPPNAVGVSVSGLGTAWQLFKASEYGIGRYEVAVPVSFQ